MKNILKIFLFIFLLFISSNSFAKLWDIEQADIDAWENVEKIEQSNKSNTVWWNNNSQTSWIKKINIKVTEEIPWANCTLNSDNSTYTCSVSPWMSWFQSLVSQVIKYFTAIATLVWVLFIVISWIMLSMWWLDSWAKEESKKRITQTVIWLLLLLLSSIILMIIAPWIYS